MLTTVNHSWLVLQFLQPPHGAHQCGQQLDNEVYELTLTPNIRSDLGLIKAQHNIKAIIKEREKVQPETIQHIILDFSSDLRIKNLDR